MRSSHLICFSAYGCSNDAAQNCVAYAGCEILVETPESALKQGAKESGIITNNAPTTSAENLSGQGSETTINDNIGTSMTGFSTTAPDFAQLSEICNRNYMKVKGIEECKTSCQLYECKSLETFAHVKLPSLFFNRSFHNTSRIGCFVTGDVCNISPATCGRVSPCRDYFIPQDEDIAIEKECSKQAVSEDSDPCLKICEPYNCKLLRFHASTLHFILLFS